MSVKLQLKETLEHMKELAEAGLGGELCFNQSWDEYNQSLTDASEKDIPSITGALEYLRGLETAGQSVSVLNLENMIEELESIKEMLLARLVD